MSGYDLFISHAGADKEGYIEPLVSALEGRGVTYWLDRIEVGWGDSIALKLSEGLRDSRLVLLCLSKNFLHRPWPETEFGTALAVQNTAGVKRVLPLILNSREEILAHYPILAGFAYREFSEGIETISEELARLVEEETDSRDRSGAKSRSLRVVIESVHTGKVFNLSVDPKISVRWLADKAQSLLGVLTEADTGAPFPFRVRWVLVDSKARAAWRGLSLLEKIKAYAIINCGTRNHISLSPLDRLESLGVYDGIVFHLHAMEDPGLPEDMVQAY